MKAKFITKISRENHFSHWQGLSLPYTRIKAYTGDLKAVGMDKKGAGFIIQLPA